MIKFSRLKVVIHKTENNGFINPTIIIIIIAMKTTRLVYLFY